MAKNGQKWPKMAKNGQKPQKCPKMPKNGQNVSNWAKIAANWSHRASSKNPKIAFWERINHLLKETPLPPKNGQKSDIFDLFGGMTVAIVL